jgi:glycosyltransferase involved in cell wall biosynthesis
MRQNRENVNPDLLIDGRALLEPSGGGVFEYSRRLTSALRRSGTCTTAVWANTARFAAVEGVDLLTRWPNKLLNASMRFTSSPEIQDLSGFKAKLFWMPNPHFISLSPSTPLALTIHDVSFETYPEFFSRKQRWWHRAVAPRLLARRAEIVLAVSETTKRDIVERWGIPADRIVVTPEGVAADFFEPPPQGALADLKKRHGLPERYILQVGALEPRKNHLGTLEAYHQLRPQARFADLGLVLAGPPGWNNGPILRAIRNSPYRDDIRLLGFVSDDERRALYHSASALAFPSFYEGFGLPPLEAMASGLPVIASNSGAIGEVVGDAGILVDPYRPSEIADALSAVLDSPSLAELYVTRGRARATRFTWDACAKKTEEAFVRFFG